MTRETHLAGPISAAERPAYETYLVGISKAFDGHYAQELLLQALRETPFLAGEKVDLVDRLATIFHDRLQLFLSTPSTYRRVSLEPDTISRLQYLKAAAVRIRDEVLKEYPPALAPRAAGATVPEAIPPRDLKTTYPEHQEGKPYFVLLEHKPTGKRYEGQGATVEEARVAAQEALRKGLCA